MPTNSLTDKSSLYPGMQHSYCKALNVDVTFKDFANDGSCTSCTDINDTTYTAALVTKIVPGNIGTPGSDDDWTFNGIGMWQNTGISVGNGCTEDGQNVVFDRFYIYWRKGHWILILTLKHNGSTRTCSETHYFFTPAAGSEPEGDVYENTPETPATMTFSYAGIAQNDYDDGSTVFAAEDVDCDATGASVIINFRDVDYGMNCDHCSLVTFDGSGFDGPARCTGFNSIENIAQETATRWRSTSPEGSRVTLQKITQSTSPTLYRWEVALRAGGSGADDYRYYLETDNFMPMCGEQASPQFVHMATDDAQCSVIPSLIGIGAWNDCSNTDILCNDLLSVPTQYTFSLSGITNGSCGSCTSYNTTFTLTRNPGTCVWVDSASTPCGSNTYTGWRSRLEYNKSSGWNVRIFNGNKTLAVYGFHIDPTRSDIQKVETTGEPTSGTFTLSMEGNTTSNILIQQDAGTIATRISSGLTHDTSVIGGPLLNRPFYVRFWNENEREEKQRITISGSSLSGSFTIEFESQTTAAIAWCPEPSHIKTALEALSNVPANSIGVSQNLGTGCDREIIYDITFRSGGFSGRNVDLMTLDTGGLSGSITTETVGVEVTGHTPDVEEMTVATSFDTGGATVSTIQEGTYGPPNKWDALGSNTLIREYADTSVCDTWPDTILVEAV